MAVELNVEDTGSAKTQSKQTTLDARKMNTLEAHINKHVNNLMQSNSFESYLALETLERRNSMKQAHHRYTKLEEETKKHGQDLVATYNTWTSLALLSASVVVSCFAPFGTQAQSTGLAALSQSFSSAKSVADSEGTRTEKNQHIQRNNEKNESNKSAKQGDREAYQKLLEELKRKHDRDHQAMSEVLR